MLIVCPSCDTPYELPVVMLGAGRPVRCIRCKTVWSASPIEFLPAKYETEDGPERGFAQEDASGASTGGSRSQDSAAVLAVGASIPAATSAQADADPHWDVLEHTISADLESLRSADKRDAHLADLEGPPLVPDEARDVSNLAPPAAAADEREDIETFAARRLRFAREAHARRRSRFFSLPLLILILVGLCTALLSARERVVALAPQSAGLFAALGLPVNLRGLAFEQVRSSEQMHNSVPVLIVEGTIANVAGRSVDVPRLRFGLRNKDGLEVYAWTAVAKASSLSPGEKLSFRSELASPPQGVQDIVVRFLRPSDLDAR